MPSNTSLSNGGIVGVNVARQTDAKSYFELTRTLPGEPRYYADDEGFSRVDYQQPEFSGQVMAYWDVTFRPYTAQLYVAIEVEGLSGIELQWKVVEITVGGINPSGGIIVS